MLLLALTIVSATLAAAIPAAAGPYDSFETQPGDIIQNTLSISWGDQVNNPDPIQVDNEITVVPFSTPGTLKAFKYDPSGSSYDIISTEFSQDGEEGPFTTSPPPVDSAGNPITVMGSVPLSETNRILKGASIFLALEDHGLNFDSSSIDSVVLQVTDSITGDLEYLRIYESGPDTGLFIGYFATREGYSTTQDGTLDTQPHARIDALYSDPWRPSYSLEDVVLVGPVDPFGIFFDSRTGFPIDGVQITLIDDATGNPATVYGEDLVSIYPSTIVSGSTVTDSSGREYNLDSGEYRFPFVDLGNYHFEIDAPLGYVAPTLVADSSLQTLDGAPFELKEGSRLESFEVIAGPPIEIDIPMDGEGFITVTRKGSDDELEVGDFIEFTVTVGTNIDADIMGNIRDALPAGLRILEETVLVDSTTPGSPAELSATGRGIVFPDVVFPAGSVATITYIAQVTPQAAENTIITSSSTADAARLMANTATHDLGITPTLNTDHDILLGRVFGNGCEASYNADIDLSGIRIMLEDGTYAETDSDGFFTFRSITKGTHVVALDPLSVPRGFEPVLCENTTQKAGSAVSRFVEARGGFARQVNFHLKPSKFYDIPDPIAPEFIPSSHYGREWLQKNPSSLGLVYPEMNHLPKGRSIDIVAARGTGTFVAAYVNGEKVGNIHKRPSISAEGAFSSLDTWKGVPLEDGRNNIRIVVTDSAGKQISQDEVDVLYNDKIKNIDVVEDASILTSDGRTRPVVTFLITNSEGIPLHPGTIVSVMADDPHKFSTTSIVDGIKVQTDLASATGTVDADGLLRLRLAPVRKPGKATFRAFTDTGTTEVSAYIASEGRPFILVGLATGTASENAISDHMRPVGETVLGDIGDLSVHGRTSFFAQGVIKGKWLLTARYDSALAEERGDFFDVDPETDYIVYGDASLEGDAASSRDALYLRIEGDNGEFLYGDFDTGINTGVATYARRLTGARALFGNDVVSVSAFLSDTSQSFVEDSFAADGTTGPFVLERDDILRFSETVLVEVTDRTDPGRILSSQELQRGQDYDIDYANGRIFLSEPLMSRDADLNPNALVVRYEVDSENEDGIILGGRITTKVSENLTLGATAVHENNIAGSDGSGQLAGLDVDWKITERLTGLASIGYSQQEKSDSLVDRQDGYSVEARLRYAGEFSSVEGYIRSESTAFGIQNQTETSDQVLSAGLIADVILDTEDYETDEGDTSTRSRAIEATMQAEFNQDNKDEKLLADAAYVRTDGSTSRSIGLRTEHLSSDGSDGSSLKLFGVREHEALDGRLRYSIGQEVTLLDDGGLDIPDRGTFQAEYDASQSVTLKATHELAFDKDIQVNILGLGADIDIWEGGVFSLGTVTANGSAGSHTVGHAGFDQEVDISEQTTFSFGLDRQAPISGDYEAMSPIQEAGLSNPRLDEAYWALHAGFTRTGDIWTTGGLAEIRHADTSDQMRLKLTAGRDIGSDKAFGAEAIFFGEDEVDGVFDRDHDIKASLAWRPREASFVVLDQLRFRYDEDEASSQARVINSLYYTRHLQDGHEINLRHGIKYAEFGFSGGTYSDVLNLVGAEYRHQVTEWADIGLHGAALHSLDTNGLDYSAGASVGLTPFENGWISVGYNWTGFNDDDFSEGGQTAKGAFIQFRIKFDQNSLSKLTLR